MGSLKTICILVAAAVLISLNGCASDEEQKRLHYERGEEYLQKGELKSAQVAFQEAVQIDPEWAPAHEQLGEVSLRLGDLHGAAEAFRQAERLDPENMGVRLRLAHFYLLSRQIDESRQKVEAVLEKEPRNAEALILSAAIFEKEKEWARAFEVYRQVDGTHAQRARAFLGMARIQARQGRLAQAEALLKQAVVSEPESTQVRLVLYEFYLKRRQMDEARAELQKAIALEPRNPELYLILGHFFGVSGDFRQAEEAYLRAIALDPRSVKPLVFAGDFYERIGRGPSALAMYEKALEIKPDDPGMMDVLAKYHLENKEYEKAEGYILAALDKWPKHLQTRMLHGQLLVMQSRFKEAADLFDQLTKEEPAAVSALVHKGIALLGLREYVPARGALQKALAISPEHLKAKLMLAKISFLEQNFARAADESLEVLKMAENHYEAALILGNALLRQGKLEQAENAFARLPRIEPENPVGYYRLGVVQRMLGQRARAAENLEKALAVNPSFLEALLELIEIDIGQREYDAALAQCDAQMDKLAGHPQQQAIVYKIKGDIYRRIGEYSLAEKAYTGAIRTDRNFMRPYLDLAEMYQENEETDKAIAQYHAALENNPRQVSPHFMLGVIHDRMGKPKLAEAHYRRALDVNRRFVPALNNLAYLLAEQNRELDEALRLARQAREMLPEDPSISDTLGWVYHQKGMHADAIAAFLASLEKLPDNPTVHYHLGLAYLEAGQPDPALAEFKTALGLSENFEGAKHAKEILAGR